MKMRRLSILAGSLVAGLVALPAHAELTVVTECGQLVSGRGELAADLDCSTYEEDAVEIDKGTLFLNGFTITGIAEFQPTGERATRTVQCNGRCKIRGPGSIRGGGFHGAIGGGTRMTLQNVDISNTPVTGVYAADLSMRRSTVSGNGKIGVFHVGNKLKIIDSEINDNGSRAIMTFGADTKVRMRRATITGNAGHGILTHDKLSIRDSTITGNGLDPVGCDYYLSLGMPCADITTTAAPKVLNTDCDTSVNFDTGTTWNVCAFD
jgi:hypothetical protein